MTSKLKIVSGNGGFEPTTSGSGGRGRFHIGHILLDFGLFFLEFLNFLHIVHVGLVLSVHSFVHSKKRMFKLGIFEVSYITFGYESFQEMQNLDHQPTLCVRIVVVSRCYPTGTRGIKIGAVKGAFKWKTILTQ